MTNAVLKRQKFRKHFEFIVTRPLRLTATVTLEPGTKIDKSQFNTVHLRGMYRRKRIGVEGSQWANDQVAFYYQKYPEQVEDTPSEEAPLVPKKDGKKWTVEGYDVTFTTKKGAQEFIDQLSEDDFNVEDE